MLSASLPQDEDKMDTQHLSISLQLHNAFSRLGLKRSSRVAAIRFSRSALAAATAFLPIHQFMFLWWMHSAAVKHVSADHFFGHFTKYGTALRQKSMFFAPTFERCDQLHRIVNKTFLSVAIFSTSDDEKSEVSGSCYMLCLQGHKLPPAALRSRRP